MKAIIKRELFNYWKNPVFYLGILIALAAMYMILSPYLNLHKWDTDGQIKEVSVDEIGDVDIMDGYIPVSEEEKIEGGLLKVQEELIQFGEMSKEAASAVVRDVREHAGSVSEVCQYLEDKYNYSFKSAYYHMEESGIRRATAQEANAFLDQVFKEHGYSWYFARKFADFGGLFLIIFAAVVMAFLFLQDTKKDMYELLHTKPVTAAGYVLGKIAGGFLVLVQVLALFTVFFTVLCVRQGRAQGFPVAVWDLAAAATVYILPNLFLVTAVYAGTALLFKNPLPALPALFVYVVYSNMGSRNAQGIYGYYGRPLAIMVRFPGRFLETALPPYVMLNQLCLILAAVVVTMLCVRIWKRRRFY